MMTEDTAIVSTRHHIHFVYYRRFLKPAIMIGKELAGRSSAISKFHILLSTLEHLSVHKNEPSATHHNRLFHQRMITITHVQERICRSHRANSALSASVQTDERVQVAFGASLTHVNCTITMRVD